MTIRFFAILQYEPKATPLYQIRYQIPGEEHILCNNMYKWAADWLVKKLNQLKEIPK